MSTSQDQAGLGFGDLEISDTSDISETREDSPISPRHSPSGAPAHTNVPGSAIFQTLQSRTGPTNNADIYGFMGCRIVGSQVPRIAKLNPASVRPKRILTESHLPPKFPLAQSQIQGPYCFPGVLTMDYGISSCAVAIIARYVGTIR